MPAVNPYISILRMFQKEKVKFILIGVSGINFYADEPGKMFFTQDCDLLLKPTFENVLAAMKILIREGYKLESNREPLTPIDHWLAQKIIEHRAVVTAKKGRALQIDLVIEGGKIPYAEWDKNKSFFKVGKLKVPVGNLLMLIRAKENSNREKDRAFLKLYKIQLKEILKTKND